MCTPKKEEVVRENLMSDAMQKEEEINELLKRIERWEKLIKENRILKESQTSLQVKLNQKQVKAILQEVRMASKALLLIRQAALKDLLEMENRQYLEELTAMGKTFYKQRI
ncbi:cilia- and flagella-associated protein 141-like [Hemiscyllium ocellatum]|uniref:cilia- and flagella-associated protein 141-like n=1 Tax=Hemiscyllium ocellatum TaxID=170820 RepID=UPI00296655EE|nr:cilia- and flagella-associated protein 141-like [Hemiscyllium ocellatum]XP_060679140.1 cilia- and flagella-associated protein 141-like [Hemiscyllium ocellatum]